MREGIDVDCLKCKGQGVIVILQKKFTCNVESCGGSGKVKPTMDVLKDAAVIKQQMYAAGWLSAQAKKDRLRLNRIVAEHIANIKTSEDSANAKRYRECR